MDTLFSILKAKTNVIAYTQLAEDPTSQLIISWVCRDSLDKKGKLEIGKYDETPTELNAEVKPLPRKENLVLCTVKINSLDPDTEYHFSIANENKVRKTKTLPVDLNRDIKIGIGSDPHHYGKGHNKHNELLRQCRGVDIFVGGGDYVDCEGVISKRATEEWVLFLKMFDDELYEKENYVPIILTIGNHDTTPHLSDSGAENANYLRFFFENPKNLNPVGENYGAVTVSDYLQLFIMDTRHTASPESQGEWISKKIDGNVKHIIPVIHYPMFPTSRNPFGSVPTRMRNSWLKHFLNAGVKAIFEGHDHGFKRTVPLGISHEQPEHGDNEKDKGYFELDGGYLIKDENGFVAFGDGCWGSNTRDRWNPNSTWYLDIAQDNRGVWKKGVSGEEHETDGEKAGDEWEHVYIVILNNNIRVRAVKPTGQTIYDLEL